MTDPIAIVLDCEQSEVLREAGSCFVVIGQGSWPDNVGRMVLHALPCETSLAVVALEVARGERAAPKGRQRTRRG